MVVIAISEGLKANVYEEWARAKRSKAGRCLVLDDLDDENSVRQHESTVVLKIRLTLRYPSIICPFPQTRLSWLPSLSDRPYFVAVLVNSPQHESDTQMPRLQRIHTLRNPHHLPHPPPPKKSKKWLRGVGSFHISQHNMPTIIKASFRRTHSNPRRFPYEKSS